MIRVLSVQYNQMNNIVFIFVSKMLYTICIFDTIIINIVSNLDTKKKTYLTKTFLVEKSHPLMTLSFIII